MLKINSISLLIFIPNSLANIYNYVYFILKLNNQRSLQIIFSLVLSENLLSPPKITIFSLYINVLCPCLPKTGATNLPIINSENFYNCLNIVSFTISNSLLLGQSCRHYYKYPSLSPHTII